jgi:hypothetical protein
MKTVEYNFKKGDKVIPIKKTPICDLASSHVWKLAIQKKQYFLYIVDIEENDGYIFCNYEDTSGGDYFYASDLVPYIPVGTEIPAPRQKTYGVSFEKFERFSTDTNDHPLYIRSYAVAVEEGKKPVVWIGYDNFNEYVFYVEDVITPPAIRDNRIDKLEREVQIMKAKIEKLESQKSHTADLVVNCEPELSDLVSGLWEPFVYGESTSVIKTNDWIMYRKDDDVFVEQVEGIGHNGYNVRLHESTFSHLAYYTEVIAYKKGE